MSHNPGHDEDVAGTDDLTRIGGIGSKTAEKLNAAGIATYADLTSRSADDIVKLLPDVPGLSAARVDGWRDEAGELAVSAAAAAAAAPAPEIGAEPPGNGQHYESFLIRVLLNENGSIRRTTAQHIRTGAKRHWPGLEREALPDFIEAAIASATAPDAQAPAADQPAEAAVVRAPRPAAGPLAGARRARRASSAIVSVERIPLRAAEPFTMSITIDLADPARHGDRLAYSAVVVARPLTGGPKQTVAQSEGLIAIASPTISIDATGLPPGAYRLDGAVSLREPGASRPVDLAALAEGLLVQVLPG